MLMKQNGEREKSCKSIRDSKKVESKGNNLC